MGRNVEIKTHLRDRARVEAVLAQLGAQDCGVEVQVDVFWDAPRARLKLRTSSRDGDQLIAYSRTDDPELRTSRYDLVPVADAAGLRRALDHALAPAGEVRKERHLYWVDNVRGPRGGVARTLRHPAGGPARRRLRGSPARCRRTSRGGSVDAAARRPYHAAMTAFHLASAAVPLPDALRAELVPWRDALRAAAGSGLEALYVYGSVLTPRYDRATSDINLLAVLDEFPAERLDALAAAAAAQQKNQAGPRVTPLVLTQQQIRDSADVFPVEFLDLARRRAVLDGTDVLCDLRLEARNLRLQCESELRSKLVGIRQAYLLRGAAPGTAQALLVRAGGGSAAVFGGLLALRDAVPPDAPEDLAAAVAAAYGVPAVGLGAPFAARRTPAEDGPARRNLAAYIAALEALIQAVDAIAVD